MNLVFFKRIKTVQVISTAVGLLCTIVLFQNCSSKYDTTLLEQTKSSLASLDTPGALLPGTEIVNGKTQFVCNPANVPLTPMVKLSTREFKIAVFGIIDDFSSDLNTPLSSDSVLKNLANSIPSDVLAEDRIAFKEQNSFLNQLTSNSYFNFVLKASELVANSTNGLGKYSNTNGCLIATPITKTCYQSFVKELGSRAFRKTLSLTEGNALADRLWDATLSTPDLLKVTLASVLLDPSFLYRVYDQGTVSNRGARVLNLTAEELASKLSFLITGKAPDANLKQKALSGQILNPVVLSGEVDRLMVLPEAQDMIRRLFRESYGYDRFDAFNYSTEFLSGITTANLPAAMSQELDRFFVDTVLTNNGTFYDLMTSQNSNITDSNLAKVYGFSSAPGATVLPSERTGFINRAAFLAKKSGNYTSPVKRGLVVLENVLCQSIGNPPPTAPTSVTESEINTMYHTTRERYSGLTEIKGTSCILCHSRINSLGFNFEKYDSLGRFRTAEKIYTTATGPAVASLPVDTQTTVSELTTTSKIITDSVDLANNLANNDRALMCFVSRLKKFESRRNISSSDSCQMNNSLKVLYGSGGSQGSIKQALKNLILSDDFKIWSY